MADNIAPEEVKRRLNLFLRIPTETWTDVLALLSRQILTQKIAPVCYRLKEICDKNVKSVHLIKRPDHLLNFLVENDKYKTKQQLELLAANKCTTSTDQFRLAKSIKITEKNWETIFRHCSDLLRGCRIVFDYDYYHRHYLYKRAFFTKMEQFEPVLIELHLAENYYQPDKKHILEHPTVWKCNRLSLELSRFPKEHCKSTMFTDIHKWLHQGGEGIRCMILSMIYTEDDSPFIKWLLCRCIQNFEQSGKPTDRRKFVLNFTFCFGPNTFDELAHKFDRIENHSTGEVLQLQLEDTNFRLRRCLAEEVEGQEEFYEKLFKRWYGGRGVEKFNMDEWKKTTKVRID